MKYKIGIDLGGTWVKIGILDTENNFLDKTEIPTHNNRPWQEIMEDIALATKELCDSLNIDLSSCSVGVGCPGTIDNGVVIFAGNFLDMVNAPVAQELSKLLQTPVKLENDANCSALGEFICGAGKGYKDIMVFTLGTGVGGGYIKDGEIFRGFKNQAGEFGHMTLQLDGIGCSCGKRGCMESYCSVSALIKSAVRGIKTNPRSTIFSLAGHNLLRIDGKVIFAAARQGDSFALSLLDDFYRYLAHGIINVVNIFAPEIILISGGISAQGDFLINPVKKYVQENFFGNEYLSPPIIATATLANDAGMVGAANL